MLATLVFIWRWACALRGRLLALLPPGLCLFSQQISIGEKILRLIGVAAGISFCSSVVCVEDNMLAARVSFSCSPDALSAWGFLRKFMKLLRGSVSGCVLELFVGADSLATDHDLRWSGTGYI